MWGGERNEVARTSYTAPSCFDEDQATIDWIRHPALRQRKRFAVDPPSAICPLSRRRSGEFLPPSPRAPSQSLTRSSSQKLRAYEMENDSLYLPSMSSSRKNCRLSISVARRICRPAHAMRPRSADSSSGDIEPFLT